MSDDVTTPDTPEVSGSAPLDEAPETGSETPPAPDVSGPVDQEPPAPLGDEPLVGADVVEVAGGDEGELVRVIERSDVEGSSDGPVRRGSGSRLGGRPESGRPVRRGSGKP